MSGLPSTENHEVSESEENEKHPTERNSDVDVSNVDANGRGDLAGPQRFRDQVPTAVDEGNGGKTYHEDLDDELGYSLGRGIQFADEIIDAEVALLRVHERRSQQ